jgi:hypothetical protein
MASVIPLAKLVPVTVTVNGDVPAVICANEMAVIVGAVDEVVGGGVVLGADGELDPPQLAAIRMATATDTETTTRRIGSSLSL